LEKSKRQPAGVPFYITASRNQKRHSKNIPVAFVTLRQRIRLLIFPRLKVVGPGESKGWPCERGWTFGHLSGLLDVK
jgi:hypothetical protein